MTGERAVSVPVNYTMSIMIVTVLLTGLVLSTGNQLQTQQERTVESEFGVLGNRIAADVSAADRLVQSTGDLGEDVVEVRTDIPATVADLHYQVDITSTEIVAGELYEVTITFESNRLSITEEVTLKTATEVEDSTITGGDYVIVYDDATDTLEVQHA